MENPSSTICEAKHGNKCNVWEKKSFILWLFPGKPVQRTSRAFNGPHSSGHHLGLDGGGGGGDDDTASLPSYDLALEIEKLSGCVSFEPRSRRESGQVFDSLHNLNDVDAGAKVTSQRIGSTSTGVIVEPAHVPSSPPPDYEENFISAEAREEIMRVISKHLNKITRRLK